jgi:hypothetical protein
VWTLESRWFDAAALTLLLVALTVLFDRFERHKPAWRRIGKIAALVALVLVAIEGLGRAWGYAILGLLLAAGTSFHFLVLSRLGINGWTGEPRQQFEALLQEIQAHGEVRTLWKLALGRPSSNHGRPGSMT